jgi:hypothetical protein
VFLCLEEGSLLYHLDKFFLGPTNCVFLFVVVSFRCVDINAAGVVYLKFGRSRDHFHIG